MGLKYLTAVCTFAALTSSTGVGAQCTAETFGTKMKSCLQGINRLSDFTKSVSSKELDIYCKTQAETEVECAENLFNECRRDPNVRRQLDKVVNINAIKSSVKIVCKDTKVLDENQRCLNTYLTIVQECIADAYRNYQSQLKGLELRVYIIDKREEDLNEASCDHIDEVKGCLRTYGTYCGRAVGDLFDALVEALTPPVCSAMM